MSPATQTNELNAYLSRIHHSGLLPGAAEIVAEYAQLAEAAEDPVERLGALLTENGLLTPWQHAQLAQGKHEGFFLGSYKLLDFVSKGGLAAHIAAEHSETGERVILKVLLPELAQKTSMLERFHKEVEATRRLQHANLMRVYELGAANYPGIGTLNYMITEYFRGMTLLERIERDGPCSPEDAADWITQAARGLDYAHQHGIVHRNLKPTNLWIDSRGMIKLSNLGVARFLDESDGESLTLRYDEKTIGTVEYMAPEQLIDAHRIDERTDVYSLGCVLYYLLTGSHRFLEGTQTARMVRVLKEKPPSITQYRSDVPPEMVAVCERMMEKIPGERVQTAKEAAKSLQLFCRRGKIELFDDDQTNAPQRGDTTLLRDLLDAAGKQGGLANQGQRKALLDFMRDFGD